MNWVSSQNDNLHAGKTQDLETIGLVKCLNRLFQWQVGFAILQAPKRCEQANGACPRDLLLDKSKWILKR